MAFGDIVQTAQASGATIFQADLTVTAPTAGNLLGLLVFGQGAFTKNAGNFEAGFTERLKVSNADGSFGGPPTMVLYDKISDGTEGTTIHAEWTDFNSGVVDFVEIAAAGATIAHDVSAAVKQTNTGSTMASGNVDPTDGQQSIVLGIFGRIVGSGAGSSFSLGTIKGSTAGVSETIDFASTFWASSIQRLIDTNVSSGNYFSGVTAADNISGDDVGVAGIAIYKGGAGGGGGGTPYNPWPQTGPILAQRRKGFVGWNPLYDHRRRVRRPSRSLLLPNRKLILPSRKVA